MPEKINYTTIDGINIVGDWYTSPTLFGAVILLHMMPADRTSWKELQAELAKKGLASLAIDMRGHGESSKQGAGMVLDYRKFTDQDQQAKLMDVMGAIDWVRKRGLELSTITLVGASIGANLCVKMLTEEPLLNGAALLSPGADYSGLKSLDDAQYLQLDQKLLIVSSEDDAQSFEGSKKLYETSPSEDKTFIPYKNAGHGTDMFKVDAGLRKKIADWIFESLRG